jgi:phage gp45-like
MQHFFGTIQSITITANRNNIQTYACDVKHLTNGELYNNCIMHFCYGMQSYPFIGQRVQVNIISNNNYICLSTSAQVYSGLETKDVAFGRLTDNITIKFTKDTIEIGIPSNTPQQVIINAINVEVNAENTGINGNLTVSGNINVDGSATITGKSTASDHISGGISGKEHTHPTTAPGNPTGAPTP